MREVCYGMRSVQRLHLVIRGRVQGVSYRYSTVQQARALGVAGWVRNLNNGDVELVGEGANEALEALVAWCSNGPPLAVVDDIEVTWLDATGEFVGFRLGPFAS